MYKEISNAPVDIADKDVALKVIDVFKEKFSINLTGLHSFLIRRRLALAFKSQGICIEEFIVNNDLLSPESADQMLGAFFPDHSEMFRDIETWLIIRDKVFNSLCEKKVINILFPYTTMGEEIYSLLILLKEFYPAANIKLKISSSSDWALRRISNGYIVRPKSRLFLANYKLLCDKNEISDYFEKANNTLCFKRELLNNVEFVKCNDENVFDEELYDFIICRNKTLSFNHEEATKIILKTIAQVSENGVIVFGVNENIPKSLMNNFHAISWSEKIFQRKAHEK